MQNNPINRFDPTGKFDFWKIGAMMNTGVAVMQSQVNSAMNSQVSFSVGSASSMETVEISYN